MGACFPLCFLQKKINSKLRLIFGHCGRQPATLSAGLLPWAAAFVELFCKSTVDPFLGACHSFGFLYTTSRSVEFVWIQSILVCLVILLPPRVHRLMTAAFSVLDISAFGFLFLTFCVVVLTTATITVLFTCSFFLFLFRLANGELTC